MMRPDASKTIGAVIQRLATHTIPALGDEFAIADAGLMASLLAAAMTETEAGIERRMSDLAQMRAIFEQAQSLADLPDNVRSQLTAGEPGDLRLSTVTAVHDDATAALIELHACVELRDDSAAVDVSTAIWRYLAASADRHAIEGPIT